ncbi:PDZ-like domain [Aspergillus terreus]|uniref:PDZ-like domain n=1 Tax=Aspergillus terreus TaxID=33178 RepID=A0A5M3Z198_ASPTE|nr:hypothetical protein ATETN484_0005064300 [Aspergillus terreus]GFF17295.1 PDZ-like domain [Aspergillus terreus]
MDPNGYAMQPPQQHPAGYPMPTQSPQQFPYYPNAMPSFPQPKNQQQFAGMPMQPVGPGGAMMPAGYPQQSPGPHANFSAPFSQPPIPASMNQFLPPQSAPTTAANLPTTTAASFPPNMTSIPANNMLPAQSQQQQQTQPHQQQRAMSQSSTTQGAVPPAAQSPAASREKARVSVLLDINSMLLQEVVNLQAAGKAGGPPPQPGSQDSNNPSPSSDQASDAAKGPTQKPSPEYVDCMRRLQANLAYLANIADRAKKSGGVPPQAPAIMTPPPHMPSMNDIYAKLSELFPRSAQGGTPQPGSQGVQGNGNPSPSPAAESVI